MHFSNYGEHQSSTMRTWRTKAFTDNETLLSFSSRNFHNRHAASFENQRLLDRKIIIGFFLNGKHYMI